MHHPKLRPSVPRTGKMHNLIYINTHAKSSQSKYSYFNEDSKRGSLSWQYDALASVPLPSSLWWYLSSHKTCTGNLVYSPATTLHLSVRFSHPQPLSTTQDSTCSGLGHNRSYWRTTPASVFQTISSSTSWTLIRKVCLVSLNNVNHFFFVHCYIVTLSHCHTVTLSHCSLSSNIVFSVNVKF